MFKSKRRPIIVPQYEHGRMAGTLASLWGNENFDRPEIDFDAFVKGVMLHDWHYGLIDDLAIGGANEEKWLTMAQRGVAYWFDDPVTDIVVKMHISRLLSGHTSPDVRKLQLLNATRIAERLAETKYTQAAFAWADKITAFCDMVTFDFSFEEPLKREMRLHPKRDARTETTIKYQIISDGEISVSPWTFSVESIQGVVIGYQAENYPEVLTPEPITFRMLKG